MTNAELIEKIRNEIERLKKEELTRNSIGVITGSAFFVSANELLSFLSTLESEKPTQEEWELNSLAYLEQLGYTCIPEGAHSEIPNDLEEAADEYLQKVKAGFLRTLEHPTAKDCFKDGAKWQKEQMMEEAVEGIAVINANAKTDGFGYVRSDYLPDDFLRGLGNFRLVIVKEDAE